MTTAIRILLVDDEPPCRDALRSFLQSGCPEAIIVGEASSLAEATEIIPKVSPDLLLLDLSMEDGTGFELLDRFPNPDFQVIFTTAFDNFALKAFKYSAIDYLLKPVDPTELIKSVRRAAVSGIDASKLLQLDQLRHNTSTQTFNRITLSTGDGLLFINISEILRLEANGNYSFVFLENNERHLVAQSLASFEEILPSPPFFRTHLSHIVNVSFVRKLTKEDGDHLLMLDKSMVPLARRRKDAFVNIMSSMNKP